MNYLKRDPLCLRAECFTGSLNVCELCSSWACSLVDNKEGKGTGQSLLPLRGKSTWHHFRCLCSHHIWQCSCLFIWLNPNPFCPWLLWGFITLNEHIACLISISPDSEGHHTGSKIYWLICVYQIFSIFDTSVKPQPALQARVHPPLLHFTLSRHFYVHTCLLGSSDTFTFRVEQISLC